MSDILDEVKNSIHEERNQTVFRYALISLMVIGFISIVVAIGYTWFNNHKVNQINKEGTEIQFLISKINSSFSKGQNPKNVKEELEARAKIVEQLEDYLTKSKTIYSAIGNFYLANFYVMQKNYSKAVYYYQKISANNDYNPDIRNYALLINANLKLAYQETDPKEIIQLIKTDYTSKKQKDKKSSFDIPFDLLESSLLIKIGANTEAASKLSNIVANSENNDNSISTIANPLSIYAENLIRINQNKAPN